MFLCIYIYCNNSVLCIYNVGARNSVFCYISLFTVARLIIHIIFTIVLFTLLILFFLIFVCYNVLMDFRMAGLVDALSVRPSGCVSSVGCRRSVWSAVNDGILASGEVFVILFK